MLIKINDHTKQSHLSSFQAPIKKKIELNCVSIEITMQLN